MSRVDADIGALKELRAALARYAYAQREVLTRAAEQASTACAVLAERASRYQAELDDQGGSCRDPAGADWDGAVDRYERARRWQHRLDEQVSAYLVASERFRMLLEGGIPRAQSTLSELIAKLEAVSRTGMTSGIVHDQLA